MSNDEFPIVEEFDDMQGYVWENISGSRITDFADWHFQMDAILQFHNFELKYNEIISLTDNHSLIDNQKLTVTRDLKGAKEIRRIYYTKVATYYLGITAVFLFPIILVWISI
ncbi:hypothetical protein [Cohnella phaseoli]|nr:hypothetical protein [Cohnella phaseoli]